FSQAHVVGEHTTESIRGEVRQEMKPCDLVGAQFGADARRNRRRNSGLYLRGTAMNLLGLLLRKKLAGGIIGELQRMQALWLASEIACIQPEPGQRFILFFA